MYVSIRKRLTHGTGGEQMIIPTSQFNGITITNAVDGVGTAHPICS